MLVGIVDIGTNTMHMNVFDCQKDCYEYIVSKRVSYLLLDYVEGGILNREGMDRLCKEIRTFQADFASWHTSAAYYFASASLRNLLNQKEVLDKIFDQCGVCVDVISSKEEAKLGFLAAMESIEEEQGLFIDVGGGSSEIVTFMNRKMLLNVSLSLGSLSLYKQCVKATMPSEKEKERMKQIVLAQLEELLPVELETMCVIGGSAKLIEKMMKQEKGIRGKITIEQLDAFADSFHEEEKDMERIRQIRPDRVKTLVPGLIIIQTIAHYYHVQSLHIVHQGVREGYLQSKLNTEKSLV